MKAIVRAAVLGIAIIGPAAAPAIAQIPADLRNPQIEIAYGEPANPAYRPIYERLKRRQVLEELQAFLAPLKLPRTLQIKVDQCGALYSPYKPGGPATICYEYIALIERLAPDYTVQIGNGTLSRETAVIGPFVQTALHEVAIAAFDLLQIPVWGRRDDAADKVAGFLMMQFGPEVAWKTIIGSAWFLSQATSTGMGNQFTFIRSAEAQRFYNYLCIAYGADKKRYEFLVRNNDLPAYRAQGCDDEYAKLKFAFSETILPFVDQALMKRVQGVEWVRGIDK